MTTQEIRSVLNRGLSTSPMYVEDLFGEADYYDEFNNSTIPTREILVYYFRGFSDNKIGSILGMSHTGVSNRINNFCNYLIDSEWNL